MNFAKLFQLSEHSQVLLVLTVDHNDEREFPKLNITTDIDGIEITLGMGFDNDENARKAFDAYTKENAFAFYSEMKIELTEPDPQQN